MTVPFSSDPSLQSTLPSLYFASGMHSNIISHSNSCAVHTVLPKCHTFQNTIIISHSNSCSVHTVLPECHTFQNATV